MALTQGLPPWTIHQLLGGLFNVVNSGWIFHSPSVVVVSSFNSQVHRKWERKTKKPEPYRNPLLNHHCSLKLIYILVCLLELIDFHLSRLNKCSFTFTIANVTADLQFLLLFIFSQNANLKYEDALNDRHAVVKWW